MKIKPELDHPRSTARHEHHPGDEHGAAELAEAENQPSSVLGMELIKQAVEARDWLSSAQSPEERQLVFLANMQRWLGMRGAFEKDKAKRQDEELAGGWVDVSIQDIFLADSLDNVAIEFCNEVACLWAEQAMADPEVRGYSSDYYEQMWDVDIGGGSSSDQPCQASGSLLTTYARFTANSYAQDYLHGNPAIGPDSIWGEFLPSPGKTTPGDALEDLSGKLRANETLRQEFRQALVGSEPPDYWSSFRGFTKGLLKSLSGAYESAIDSYETRLTGNNQEVERCAAIGRAAIEAVAS